MDAAKRKQLLESFGSAPDRLNATLKNIDPEVWNWSPAQTEWNVRQIIFHITDSEAHYHNRIRQAIAEPGGMVIGFNQNKWTESLAYPDRSTDEALTLFSLLRKSSYNLLVQLPQLTWSNTVQHSERGTLSLETLFTIAENHITEHLKQIETNVTQYQNR